MVQIAMYDAVNASTGLRYEGYSYDGPRLANASAEAAAYAVGYGMLAKPYPDLAVPILAQRDAKLAFLAISPGTLDRGPTLGSGVAVPELARWAMMLAGFGMPGMRLRHRRATVLTRAVRQPALSPLSGVARPVV